MNKNVTAIANFNGFKSNPVRHHKWITDVIPGYPKEAYSRAKDTFCEAKKAMLESSSVSSRTAIGENDALAINLIHAGMGDFYISDTNHYIGELTIRDKTTIAIIDPFRNAKNELPTRVSTYDHASGRWNAIHTTSDSPELAAVTLAIMAYVFDSQATHSETPEIETTIKNILSGSDVATEAYKLAGITYYETYDTDLDLGLNFSAGIADPLTLDTDLNILETLDFKGFGKYEPQIAGKKLEVKAAGTAKFLSDLSQTGPVQWSVDEISECDDFKSISIDTPESQSAFTNIYKMMTMNFRRKMRKPALSMVLSGASGAGKSTLTRISAKLAGLEYRPVVSTDEKFSEEDLAAKLVPYFEVDDSVLSGVALPDENGLIGEYSLSYTDIFMAPGMAYQAIYGKEYDSPEPLNPEVLCKELVKREVSKGLESTPAREGKFMMVLTEIGKTLLYGGVTEIQEYNMIANTNETSYFYRILEERMFSLPNGMVLPVHPNAHLVFTMNQSEGFTRDLPPAFRNRHYMTLRFDPSTADTMANQAIAAMLNDGLKVDKSQVGQMANFMVKARKFADYEELLSVRALINWIHAVVDGETIENACLNTVINVASSNAKNINQMWGMLQASPLYEAHFKASDVIDEKI